MKLTDHDGPAHAGGAVATCRRCRAIANDIVRAAIAARVRPKADDPDPVLDSLVDFLEGTVRPLLMARAWGVSEAVDR